MSIQWSFLRFPWSSRDLNPQYLSELLCTSTLFSDNLHWSSCGQMSLQDTDIYTYALQTTYSRHNIENLKAVRSTRLPTQNRLIDRSLTNHTFKQDRIMFRSTGREFQLTNKFNEFPQVFETWMKSNKQYSFSIKVLLSVIVNYKPQCLVWKKNWNVTVLMNCRSLCM